MHTHYFWHRILFYYIFADIIGETVFSFIKAHLITLKEIT